jgi:hypothetical protein
MVEALEVDIVGRCRGQGGHRRGRGKGKSVVGEFRVGKVIGSSSREEGEKEARCRRRRHEA